MYCGIMKILHVKLNVSKNILLLTLCEHPFVKKFGRKSMKNKVWKDRNIFEN